MSERRILGTFGDGFELAQNEDGTFEIQGSGHRAYLSLKEDMLISRNGAQITLYRNEGERGMLYLTHADAHQLIDLLPVALSWSIRGDEAKYIGLVLAMSHKKMMADVHALSDKLNALTKEPSDGNDG